ncbi:uncharacterized protein LOC62_02G003493 [Vanrija pseudolonga]|uniref:Uncharacterized protein n=1 Tax=Vanrija pseudolonga TaxID=143232 RepID=A0AAF1BHB2_9TREE|nr:hypothetical protein LOC62_02G003493 [Vanrija pseudolonga]
MFKALLIALLVTATMANPVPEADPAPKPPVNIPPPDDVIGPTIILGAPGTVFAARRSPVSGVVGCGPQSLLQCKGNGYYCVPRYTACCTANSESVETERADYGADGATYCPTGSSCINLGKSCRVNYEVLKLSKRTRHG